ncbi:hypothetical protein UlMin_019934 [Ulmus minor]
MPLPWKKTKVTRISQIVADLQTPKHGGSLVVVTGFPTSLIDLFVKNRDRLKTPSMKKKNKKKKKNSQINDVDSQNSDEIAARSRSNSSICVEPSCGEVDNLSVEPSDSCSVGESESSDKKRHVVVEEFVGGSSVFLVLLKIFAVVVLALSTKKLAVGITLSAFLLLCLEYLGKHFLCFFKPCSAAKEALKSMIRRVSISIPLKKDLSVEAEAEEEEVVLEELVDGSESNSIVEEIEILEPKIDIEEKGYSCEKTNVIEEGEILVEKNKSSKKGKIRAKLIKNFVPKKLRSSKKSKKYKGNESSSDVSSYFEDDASGKLEEQQEQEHEHRKQHPQESRNIGSKWVSVQEMFEKEDINYENCSFHGNLEVEMELEVVGVEEGREERQRSLGNWVHLSLFLIVLAGLFGGRILALLLTIAWCVMLKLIGRG